MFKLLGFGKDRHNKALLSEPPAVAANNMPEPEKEVADDLAEPETDIEDGLAWYDKYGNTAAAEVLAPQPATSSQNNLVTLQQQLELKEKTIVDLKQQLQASRTRNVQEIADLKEDIQSLTDARDSLHNEIARHEGEGAALSRRVKDSQDAQAALAQQCSLLLAAEVQLRLVHSKYGLFNRPVTIFIWNLQQQKQAARHEYNVQRQQLQELLEAVGAAEVVQQIG